MKKEKIINKGLKAIVSLFKRFVKRYLIKSKYQRQTENEEKYEEKLEQMHNNKIKRWKNEKHRQENESR